MDEQQPEIRLSDDERDVVVTRLRIASTEGRITLDEFGERSRQVYAAHFPSEIEHLTRDLPAVVGGAANPTIVRTLPETPVSRSTGQKRRWLVQIMGGANRTGKWDASAPITSLTLMGGQDIDLTEVDADEVTITAFTLMGGTDIIVPDGAMVDLGGFMIFGGIGDDARTSGDSPMRVRVRAWGGMGACEVRNLTDKERAKRNRTV